MSPHIRLALVLFVVGYSSLIESQPLQQLESPYSDYEQLLQSTPKTVLEKLNADTPQDRLVQAQRLLILSQTYYILVYPDKALKAAQQGLQLISESSQPWLYHNLRLSESLALDITGQSEAGIEPAKLALNWARMTKDKDLEILALVTLGHLHTTTIKYLPALDYLQQAYDLADNETRTHRSEVAGIIAVLYEERRENALSIPYFQEAVDYNRKQNNLIELSIVTYGLGRALANIGKVEQGVAYLQESAELSKQVDDHQGIAYAYKELAGIHINNQEFDQALELLEPALHWFEESNNKFMLFDVNKILSGLFLKQGDIVRAKIHFQTASQYINEDQQPLQNLALEKLRSQIMAANGNHKQAYENLYQTMIKETRLVASKSTEQLHLLRAEFDLERKEKENQILTTSNQLQNIKLESQTRKTQALQLLFVSALIILALLTILVYRSRKAQLKFQYLANHDGLTQLYNRSRILALTEDLWEKAQTNGTALHLAMMDIDHFKRINDTWGHSLGDEVLKSFARLLNTTLQGKASYGRFGGEEFLVAFSGKQTQVVIDDLEAFRSRVEQLNLKSNGETIKTTVSIGMSRYHKQHSVDQMILNADKALYQAKSSGRNQLHIFEASN